MASISLLFMQMVLIQDGGGMRFSFWLGLFSSSSFVFLG